MRKERYTRRGFLTLVGGGTLLVLWEACVGKKVEVVQTPTPSKTLPPTPPDVPTATPTLEPTPTLTATPEPTSNPTATEAQQQATTPARTPEPKPTAVPTPEIFTEVAPEKAERIANLINRARQINGFSTLELNSTLQKAAEGYALFLHQSAWLDYPDGDPSALLGSSIPEPHTRRGTSQSRAEEAGYKGEVTEILGFRILANKKALEDPAVWEDIIRGSVNGWLTSPGHRDVLLGSGWHEVGVGCAFGLNWYRPFYSYPVPQYIYVAMFGNPSSQ
mgnify:CR=1 FL=1